MKNNPFFQVLGFPNFRNLWFSQVLTQVTLNLINFVIIFKIFEVTGSTVAISIVWVFYIIPVMLVGPFSGTIVDLIERKKILFFTNLALAIIVLFYLFVQTKIWTIYGIVFLYSLVFQLYIPAEAASLPRLVSRSFLPSANSLFLFTIYGAMLIGFSAAGPLIRLVGKEAPFIIASFLLLVAALIVSFLPKFNVGHNGRAGGPQEFWDRVKEGYIFIRKNPVIFFPLLLLALAQTIITPLVLLTPSYATQILKIDLLDAGLAFVLPFGLGAILGAWRVVWLIKKIRKKKIITTALFLASFWLLILALVVPILPIWRLPLAILSVFFIGASYVSFLIPSQTLIQEKTPEKFRGRVFGVLGFLLNLASILPILLTATIADILGVTWTIFLVSLSIGGMWFYSLREPYEYGIFTHHRS